MKKIITYLSLTIFLISCQTIKHNMESNYQAKISKQKAIAEAKQNKTVKN